jgi:hypothetical protein
MATQTRHKVKKHITLSAEVVEVLEEEAQQGKVTLSDVIEAHLQSSYRAAEQDHAGLGGQLHQLIADLADLRAKVLPLVATVTAMLRQMEGELPVKLDAEQPEPALKIATYEEMYGPITPAPPREPVAPRIAPTRPRPRWRFWRPLTWEWRRW